MNRTEELIRINELLLEDQPQFKKDAAAFPKNRESQRQLMRSLMNIRYPKAIPTPLQLAQDALLQKEIQEKGIVAIHDLSGTRADARIAIWQGDITRLDADAIVNAANSQMLGCFVPCHRCIDNAIHSAAGMQLREECAEIMAKRREQYGSGYEEPTGTATITKGYNLPAKHVLHTVGPIIRGRLTRKDRELLESCYRSCLELAAKEGLESIAFCCISTGEFHFPNDEAAKIAVRTVSEFLKEDHQIKKVVFNVFKDIDRELYESLLDQ